MEIQDRIKMLLEALNESQNNFSKKIGVQSAVINHIVTGNSGNEGKRNKPSFDLLNKIIDAYPRVSLEWLIRGEGTMFKDYKGSDNIKVTGDYFENFSQEIKSLRDLILEKDKKELFYIETITNLSKH
jgi:transcriptional regulator with XRE-family HTH domain